MMKLTLCSLATIGLAATAHASSAGSLADVGDLSSMAFTSTVASICSDRYDVPADAVVPDGYEYLFVAAEGDDIAVIQGPGAFCLADPGTYSIHGLVVPRDAELASYASLSALQDELGAGDLEGSLSDAGPWLSVESEDRWEARQVASATTVEQRCLDIRFAPGTEGLANLTPPPGTWLVFMAVTVVDGTPSDVLGFSTDGSFPTEQVIAWHSETTAPIWLYPVVTTESPRIMVTKAMERMNLQTAGVDISTLAFGF